jgi:hypothetical protein
VALDWAKLVTVKSRDYLKRGKEVLMVRLHRMKTKARARQMTSWAAAIRLA